LKKATATCTVLYTSVRKAKKATQSLNFIRRNFLCCPATIHEQCYNVMLHLCGTTQSNATLAKLKGSVHLYKELHQVLQTCYRNSSGYPFSSIESEAESSCCLASATVWWLSQVSLLQFIFIQVLEGLKPDTDRSNATQAHTVFLSICGTLYPLTPTSCHRTASRLN